MSCSHLYLRTQKGRYGGDDERELSEGDRTLGSDINPR